MSNEAPTDALRLVPNMPTVELTDDMLFKIESGETVKWGELKRRQYEQAVRNFNTMREDGSLPAPASPLPGGGWHTNFDDAPKDGRWIVTLDKWRNAETMRWSNEVSRLFPEQGERGWVAKGGYSPNTRPELSVAWALIPAAPTGEPK